MRTEPIPDKEFLDKKRSLVASFALSLETPAAILNNYVTSRRYNLPADYWDKYPERMMAITKEQVQAAAVKYLDPARAPDRRRRRREEDRRGAQEVRRPSRSTTPTAGQRRCSAAQGGGSVALAGPPLFPAQL